MKKIGKNNEIIKVALICSLSIGLFGAAFIGFNQLIFATATNQTTPLPLMDANTTEHLSYEININEQILESTKTNTFIPPTLAVIESPSQIYHSISTSAILMEEAAQIGANYIWDVFGTNIDNMYVEMLFSAHASQFNTWWLGRVFIENPENPTIYYIASVYDDNQKFALDIYTFIINGITGERIDISSNNQHIRTIYDNSTKTLNSRLAILESGWFDMDLEEQIEFVGLSNEALDSYTQKVSKLANAQFNSSNVVNIELQAITPTITNNNEVYIEALNFTAIDNNGREAVILIPATDSILQTVRISTNHNDFIPYFQFNNNGSSRG